MTSNPSKKMLSYLSNAENQFIDSLYQQYQKDEQSVGADWQRFFEGLDFALEYATDSTSAATGVGRGGDSSKELQVKELLQFYRSRGHELASTNPLQGESNSSDSLLTQFGLTSEDLEQRFNALSDLSDEGLTLGQSIERLKNIYCKNFAVEYQHIQDENRRQWIQEALEKRYADLTFSPEERVQFLQKVGEGVLFEHFLHTKYTGQKRFSLEGGESCLAAIEDLLDQATGTAPKELVIGMAHRGRLNILVNIMGKAPQEVLSEFEGKKVINFEDGDGDVKYHMGYLSERTMPLHGNKVRLRMLHNPSHLETVTPVVQGVARATQDRLNADYSSEVLALQIHGDAAVAGQGVVYEVVQMSELPGYSTEGTIHLVINNQIGFTTPSESARSSRYCTGVAKVVEAPILHVNGDDLEAVVRAMRFAYEYRQKFHKNVFIDMICYRKHGHNEGDEPRFTQPVMYTQVDAHTNPLDIYRQKLLSSGLVSEETATALEEKYKQRLQLALQEVKESKGIAPKKIRTDHWKNIVAATGEDFEQSCNTAVGKEILQKITDTLSIVPSDFQPISKMVKLVEGRKKQFTENKIDWGLGELLAYGTLLLEGHSIRLSGQDCIRGTFSHRHSSLFDKESNKAYCHLNHLPGAEGKIEVINSLLSEYGVMGFEYGYSLVNPDHLVLWEAQFGDFANTAQVMIDQFISAAESKWQLMSGLVLLLPHGYEGQGPEHSSARIERYLQLCAEFNMIVANCTTPANFFHLLRRQLKAKYRKPLVVFTPKSLLRHPLCVSAVEDFTQKKFQEIIDDPQFNDKNKKNVKRVLLCSGKIYYELLEMQQKDSSVSSSIAIVRFEQLHPLPLKYMDKLLKSYTNAEFIWVQDEPKNMGQWNYIQRKIDQVDLKVICRKSSASPATGYSSLHKQEQSEVLQKCFDLKFKAPK